MYLIWDLIIYSMFVIKKRKNYIILSVLCKNKGM